MDLMVHPLEAAVIITSFKEWRVQVGESVRTPIFSESSSKPLATSRAFILFFPSSYFSVITHLVDTGHYMEPLQIHHSV